MRDIFQKMWQKCLQKWAKMLLLRRRREEYDMDQTEIFQKANETLKETNLLSVPVEIIAIANFYGFPVYELDLKDNLSGLIISGNETIGNYDTKKIIVVNKSDSFGRKRFTIAHELGHYILDGKPDDCYAHRDTGFYNQKEKEANIFASAILMPEDDVKKIIRNTASNYGILNKKKYADIFIQEISSRFNVSPAAAEVRLKTLDII